MIIVSDTSPLRYLVLTGYVEILPRTLGEIVIPPTVFEELRHDRTPLIVKNYFLELPDWLRVQAATNLIDNELSEIDPGEREAILLAEELTADGILIDDLAGRDVATRRGLRVIGTIGVLEIADLDGSVKFATAFRDLKRAGFFVSSTLENELRERHGIA